MNGDEWPEAFLRPEWDEVEASKRVDKHGYDPLDARVHFHEMTDGTVRFTMGGYEVPMIHGTRQGNIESEMHLHVGEPIGFSMYGFGPFDERTVVSIIGVVAEAMARIAGFSCFGGGSTKVNPFKRKVHMLTGEPSEDAHGDAHE